MVDQGHLDILKQGVYAWNEWRKEHPDIRPDLSGADLSRVNLTNADLSSTNIIRAFPSGTTFYNADLTEDNLREDLEKELREDLEKQFREDLEKQFREDFKKRFWTDFEKRFWEDLMKDYLMKALLSEAHLYTANLTNVTLDEADLSEDFEKQFREDYEKELREDFEQWLREDYEKQFREDFEKWYREDYLREAYPHKARPYRAKLTNANFDEADLSRANLGRAFLSGATFYNADLRKANLGGADLHNARLYRANLGRATLNNANLGGADLSEARLNGANLNGADLSEADLSEARLYRADLNGANLSRADLSRAILVETNLTETTLTECRIYGISAWDIELTGALQDSLVITPPNEPIITVDNLKIAQFLYLLLNNREIREVIDTIAKKAVLILGRFAPERKAVLDALREALRTHGYLPILFDFDKPASRDITETISTLAHLSRFVIADITDAKSIPQELMLIVPNLPSVPVQPLILESQREYGMFEHFKKFPWVLPTHQYQDIENLLASLQAKVIEPAEQKAQEIAKR